MTQAVQLYKISENISILESAFSNEELSEEARTAAVIDYFEQKEALEVKVKNCLFYLKNKEVLESAIDERIKALQARKKTLRNNVENFKGYLIAHMKHHKMLSVDLIDFTAKLSKSRGAVEIIDAEKIPDKYKKEKIDILINKDMINREWKSGNPVAGTKLVQKDVLRINNFKKQPERNNELIKPY